MRQGSVTFGEVLYYSRLKIRGADRTLALVHMYAPPDMELLKATFGTYYSCNQLPLGDDEGLLVVDDSSIDSVVAMIPRNDKWFLVEKITLASGVLAGIAEDLLPEPDFV